MKLGSPAFRLTVDQTLLSVGQVVYQMASNAVGRRVRASVRLSVRLTDYVVAGMPLTISQICRQAV
jgi:hypothetical protein